MKNIEITGCFFRAGLVVLVAGCGSGVNSATMLPAQSIAQNTRHHMTFNYVGYSQTFTVPAGVASLRIDAFGAAGGPGNGHRSTKGGNGGVVKADVPVTPGEKLTVFVGGAGATGATGSGDGGFNGGGSGGGPGPSDGGGGGGGGASDVRQAGDALSDRVIVAGAEAVRLPAADHAPS